MLYDLIIDGTVIEDIDDGHSHANAEDVIKSAYLGLLANPVASDGQPELSILEGRDGHAVAVRWDRVSKVEVRIKS